jgi:hypothetical protein
VLSPTPRASDLHQRLPECANDQKLIQDSFKQYSPIALADLPKIDGFIKTSCGFPLRLAPSG